MQHSTARNGFSCSRSSWETPPDCGTLESSGSLGRESRKGEPSFHVHCQNRDIDGAACLAQRVPETRLCLLMDANFFLGQIQDRDVRVNVSVNVNSSGLDEIERRLGTLGSISASISGGITGNPSTNPGTTDEETGEGQGTVPISHRWRKAARPGSPWRDFCPHRGSWPG